MGKKGVIGVAEQPIPRATVKRLPLYYRFLQWLYRNGRERVSSWEISESLRIDPATIRRDLAYLGGLGKKGYGYNVPHLIQFLTRYLGQDEVTNVALVGAGNLGMALLRHNFYKTKHLHIFAAFDVDEKKIGRTVNGIPIYAMDDFAEVVRREGIEVAILTVPVPSVGSVVEQLVAAGIRGILNFSPIRLKVPPHVRVHNIDVTMELQTLIYFLKHDDVGQDALP